MNVYPIGNNLTVKWTLRYSDGTVFPLSLYDYELSYRTSRGVKVATDTTVEDNVLRWILKADEQIVSGPYSLALKITLAGNKAVDLQYNNAFALTSLCHGNGANVEVCIESNCDVIDLKDAVLQSRKAMDLAAGAVKTSAESAKAAAAAQAAAEKVAGEFKNTAQEAQNAAQEAQQSAQEATANAQKAQASAATASEHITSLNEAIAELPDGQAVSEKVAEHTTEIAKHTTKITEINKQIVYDVTANNGGVKFNSISALLSSENLSTLIPDGMRCGGISIRFVQSSDNKYVQYRLMSDTFNTTVANWQGVDDEPTTGSDNLIKSGGVSEYFDNITTGKVQSLTLNEGYLSIENNPQIATSSNYHYSNPFHVTRGQTVTLTCWANSTLPFTVMASYKDNVYTKLLGSTSSSATFEQKTYSFTAYEDTYIVVCGRTQGGKTIDVLVSDGTEMADKASVNKLQSDVIGLLGAIDGYEPELTLIKGYYIALDGTKAASSGRFCYTSPIQVEKGDRIILNCTTDSNQICTISIVDESNKFIKRIAVGINDENNHEYVYVAENDCYVCLCFNYRYNYNAKIKKADDKTQGLIDYAEIELSHDISRQYYNYKQHDYADGRGLWFSKTININGEKYLHISKGQTSTGVTNEVALINFLDSSNSFISAHYSYISNSSPIIEDLVIPNNAAKVVINLPANWDSAEIKVWFINSVGTKFEKLETSVIWKEKYFNNSLYILDQYYDTSAHEYKPGNDVWKSIKVSVDNAKIIQAYHQLTSSTNKATLNFFDKNDSYISSELYYNHADTDLSYYYCKVPENASYVLITTLTYPPHDASRFWVGYNYKGDTHVKRFDTVRDMAANFATGLCRVGQNKMFTNIVSAPTLLSKTEPALPLPYYDNNATVSQYEAVDNKNSLQYRVLNKVGGYEKSFVPSDSGYTRVIVGKSDDDIFFISYQASNRTGNKGQDSGNKLEITRDFETFETIWDAGNDNDYIFVEQVKELANGSFIMYAQYKPTNDGTKAGYFRISSDFKTIEHIYCTDLEGNNSLMNCTPGKVSACYDWHIAIVANKVLCTEYGDRTDWGRVFYSEDSGNTFKEIFRMCNHYNEGRNPDDPTVITQTHIHGVMIDEFTGRLIVVAGESNRGVFYSDKGINTTDSDWNVIRVYDQLPLRHTRFTQLISGQTFKDCLIFGSDCEGFGGYYRLNKTEGGQYSELEIAHECSPYVLYTTSYCAASSHKAENGFPAFLCMTRENNAQTEEANEELCREHYGRVLATFDGYHFVEIYKDTTYGNHTVYNETTHAIEQHNFSYCTRDMNIYVCKNGDVVIKYTGRDFIYLGGDEYIQGTGDFSSRVYIIKGAAKYLKA